jgi:hypothetical protein
VILVELAEWFVVEWDNEEVRISATPTGMKAWEQKFLWGNVIRICYQVESFEVSDAIYIFTSKRPESYVIPTEASGGSEFWNEILDRGLFDPRLAISIASAKEGIYCWPE